MFIFVPNCLLSRKVFISYLQLQYCVSLQYFVISLFNLSVILISFAQVREALLKKMRLFESQQENSKIQTKNSKRLSNVQENLKKVKVGV